jgi:hypothetical protein
MPTARLAHGWICLLVLMSGCEAFHQYRPLTVLVRDAETKQPIGEAEVQVSYPFTPAPYAPAESSADTDTVGRARLRAAPSGDTGVLVDVNAHGYLSEQAHLSAAAVQALEPEHLFATVELKPPNVVVEMYAEPGPTVELIVPDAYRGLVKVEVQVQDDATYAHGQRCFRYEVQPSGDVQVIGPPLLRRVFTPDFRARYADGTPLNREAKDAEVGFFCLKCEGNHQVFFVGTHKEYDDMSRYYQPETTEQRSPTSDGKKGGRGGRNRRGNPSSGDATSSD